MSNYSNLDLDIIKNKVCEYAFIDEAKSFIINEEVGFNPLVIKNKSLQTLEALKLLKKEFNVNFDGIKNINEYLDAADKSITLEGKQLKDILVFHNHASRIKKQFSKLEEELSIKDYTDSINVSESIFNEIESCIDNSGEVKDDATVLLKQINYEINVTEKSLYDKAYQFINKHSTSLQEQSLFERNGRVVFLFKNSDKNKYNGYQYGTSSSGLATYVEPQILIDLNNKKLQLLEDKQNEIDKLLRKFTYMISSVSNEYRYNFDSLVKLCVVFAKAKYGYYQSGIIPSFNEGKYFEFIDLAHPLIDPIKVISNTYRIYEPYKGIVISGSNTGGKTVSLKAIGLSILMSYLGIPIICGKANIPFYKNVYVDIDDNQSIADSLSTFSAHITNINNILNKSDDKSLILIDELISGTDPKQAQAISLAILDKIKQINSIFVITTHYDDIKNYSYEDPNILLSSVGFNIETLKPTYKYLENSIGNSNALEIASRYFDDQEIIENAKRYIKKNETKQEELLNKLSKEISDYELLKEKLNKLNIENENIKNEYENKLKEFDNQKETLKQKYLNDLNDYIEDIKQKAQDKLDSIKQKDNTVINQINELVEEDVLQEEKNIEFKVGDNVRINDNEQIGTITSIEKQKAVIDIKGISVKAKLSDLKLMPKIVKKEKYVEKKRYNTVPKQINLVGQRVEDGLIAFEEYLDKANAANMSSVKIIHGIGTGALRSAIRNRLAKLKYVDKFHDGDYYDGGSAVTIVEFKK